MRLSALEQLPLFQGHTETDTLHDAARLARGVGELGFDRFWVAEHHNSPHFLSSAPDIVMTHLLGATSRIRIGSGGVMAMHYGSLQIAERFATMAALYGDRIDMGLGRAPGGDVVASAALNQGRVLAPDDINRLILEAVGLLRGTLPEDHRYAGLTVSPRAEVLPQAWLLGSSGQSAAWAGVNDLNYAYAQFFSGHQDPEAMDHYRRHLPDGHTSGRTLSALLVSAAGTAEKAEHRALAGEGFRMAQRLGLPLGFATPEQMAPEQLANARTFLAHDHAPIIGTYDEVATRVRTFADAHGCDEIMLISYLPDVEAKLGMYAELAARLI